MTGYTIKKYTYFIIINTLFYLYNVCINVYHYLNMCSYLMYTLYMYIVCVYIYMRILSYNYYSISNYSMYMYSILNFKGHLEDFGSEFVISI